VYTPEELLLIRDLLTRNRKEKRSQAGRQVIQSLIERTDALIRASLRKDAA
jgi:hypothetical protein